jgi:hypothetical protein
MERRAKVELFDSEFEELIRHRLVERGFEVVPQDLAGVKYELLVACNTRLGSR